MSVLSSSLSLLRRNPYPLFSVMRRYQPVLQIKKYGLFIAFGYEDVKRVLSDYGSFSSNYGTMQGDAADLAATEGMTQAELRREMAVNLISSDPPIHTKLRGLVTRAFTNKAVASLEPRIGQLTHEMLDAVIERGQMDLVDDLAYPLP